MKEGQTQLTCVVMHEDLVRMVWFSGRGWLMAVHPDFQGDNRTFRRQGDARLLAAVNHCMWQMRDEPDNARLFAVAAAEQPSEHLRHFRPNAAERRYASKNWIEDVWTHGVKITGDADAASGWSDLAVNGEHD